jgi:hypothetical protein
MPRRRHVRASAQGGRSMLRFCRARRQPGRRRWSSDQRHRVPLAGSRLLGTAGRGPQGSPGVLQGPEDHPRAGATAGLNLLLKQDEPPQQAEKMIAAAHKIEDRAGKLPRSRRTLNVKSYSQSGVPAAEARHRATAAPAALDALSAGPDPDAAIRPCPTG